MPKVFLNAGHGGSDPGATANGLVEKDVNLVTMLECKAVLERHGVEVVCSRLVDEDDKSRDVLQEMKEASPDVAFSFHANAGGGNGFEVYADLGNVEAKRLARLCEKYVMELGQNSRGLKDGKWLYLVKNATVPIVVVESFFLDNLSDKEIGDTVEEQRLFGVAYAKAVLEYLGMEYVEVIEDSRLYRVQVGAFSKKANAERLKDELERLGYDVIIV